MAIFAIVIIFVTIRLSVMLPAKALAAKEVTIKDVWQRTRGNFWRLLGGTILCALPVGIINMFIRPGCHADFTGITLYTINIFLYVIVALPVTLAFLSLSFKHFFEQPGAVV